MKTTTGQAKRARTLAERNKSLNCSNAFYHLGLILTMVGVLFTIIAMATSYLFYIDIFDTRKNDAKFERINIPVGLYSAYGYEYKNNSGTEEWVLLKKPLDISNSYSTAAGILVIVGLVAGIIVAIIHILFCLKENFRKRKVIFVEVIFLLIAMVGVLAGLSFGETQIEYIHDDGSKQLIDFLLNNTLTNTESVKFKTKTEEEADFNMQISPPQYSFYFLIVATFMFLLAFLFSLIYFVRLCERINKEERELRVNLTKAENVDSHDAGPMATERI